MKTGSKKSCREAIEFAEQSLMKIPKVVGLGIIRSTFNHGYRVAVYVSELPMNEKERQSFPQTLPVPRSNKIVDVEIQKIGNVGKESL
ncbi:hypothetical protein [Gimesia sp.]|uniref:hypothetical protein n=1 Tax=Gimesia sp. TaxID=2024833 RepID=UPI003A902205